MSASPEISGMDRLVGQFRARRQSLRSEHMGRLGLPDSLPAPPPGLDLHADLDGLRLDLAWGRGLAAHLAPPAYGACGAALAIFVGPWGWALAVLVLAAATLQALRALRRPRSVCLTSRALVLEGRGHPGVLPWAHVHAKLGRGGGIRIVHRGRARVLGVGLPATHQRWLCETLRRCAAERAEPGERPAALHALEVRARPRRHRRVPLQKEVRRTE